jgi:hypothetical protein
MPRRDGDVFLLGTAIGKVLGFWQMVSIGARYRAASTERAGKIADKAGLITE